MIRYGDARDLVADLEPGSVQCAFTSPPYYSTRSYGDRADAEIGWGSVDDYMADLGKVLDGVHRALDDEGSSWWVLGDKASGSGGAGGDHLTKGSKRWIAGYGKASKAPDGIRDGQWLLIPYRFAQMAQQRGWLVRSMIVWDKSPNVKPEDFEHIHRPMVSTERIILLTKQVQCRWFHKRLVQPADVWRVAPRRPAGSARHVAPFPPELPRRAILVTTERGQTVLDPFAGTGTTVDVADGLGRTGIGFELYEP